MALRLAKPESKGFLKGHQKLAGDYRDANNEVTFTQARIVKIKGGYVIGGITHHITALDKFSQEFLKPGIKTSMMFHAGTYTFKQWQKEDEIIEGGTVAENLICKIIESFPDRYPLDRTFSGKILLQSQQSIADIIIQTGKTDLCLDLQVLPDIDYQVEIEGSIVGGGNYGSFGGSKGQTELERLTDRFAFLKGQLKAGDDIKDLTDLTAYVLGNEDYTPLDSNFVGIFHQLLNLTMN